MKRREHRPDPRQVRRNVHGIDWIGQPCYPRVQARVRIRIKIRKDGMDVEIPLAQFFDNLRHRAAGPRTQIDDFYRSIRMENGRDLLSPLAYEPWIGAVPRSEIRRFPVPENLREPRLIAELKQVQPPQVTSL